ncbi:hypothetical protein FOZ63_005019, partial [Perkinsus olseni]
MKTFFDRSVPVSDDVPEHCLTCGEEGSLVDNGYGIMVQCDRCLHWFHKNKNCCDYPKNSKKHGSEVIWCCGRCRAKRQMLTAPPKARDVILPILDFIECTEMGFGDTEQPTAKALYDIISKRQRGNDIQSMVENLWHSLGEPTTAVDLMLILQQKVRLKLEDAEVGFFAFGDFASIDAQIIAEKADRSYISYLRREIGDVIRRGLRVDSLDSILPANAGNRATAQFMRENQLATERLNGYLRDQSLALTHKIWDSHELWNAVRLSLADFLSKENASAELQESTEAPLRGGHRACDLVRGYGEFLPPALVGVARRQSSLAEHTISVGDTRYRAAGFLEVAEEDVLKVRFRVPGNQREESSTVLVILYKLVRDSECSLCCIEQEPSRFAFRFCDGCDARVCAGCICNWAALAEARGNMPSCPYCRRQADLSNPAVEQFMRDLHALLKHVVSLNPKDTQTVENMQLQEVQVPFNLLGLTRTGALTFLREMNIPVARQPDAASERAVVEMYRQELGIGDDVPDNQVMDLVHENAYGAENVVDVFEPDEMDDQENLQGGAPPPQQQQNLQDGAPPPPQQQQNLQGGAPPQQQQNPQG